MIIGQSIPTSFLSAFEALRKRSHSVPSWVNEWRKVGFESFLQIGLPTKRDEEWKYTTTKPIAELDFGLAGPADLTEDEVAEAVRQHGSCDADLFVFVNGFFAPRHSKFCDRQGTPKVVELRMAWDSDADGIRAVLDRTAQSHPQLESDAFGHLRKAFFESGIYVEIPRNTRASRTVQLLFLTGGGASFPSTLVWCGSSSEASLVETHVRVGKGPALMYQGTDVVLEQNAKLHYTRIQTQSQDAIHLARARFHLARDAMLKACEFSAGGRLVRNDLAVALTGEGSQAQLDGLYLSADGQHVDNHTEVNHVCPRATSHQTYKGVLRGRGRAVFNGKVRVFPEAQGTAAFQLNKNLLMSETAEVNAKPQLEIAADDVKCSHGATVGRLNSNEIFYLESRGIERRNAENMLAHAFASEIAFRLPEGWLRQAVQKYAQDFFPAQVSHPE